MLFSELYGAYYNTVACIIKKAINHPVKSAQIEEIIKEYAFSDSSFEISQALRKKNWKLLRSDGTTSIKKAPTMPLTKLEKRWLKAIANDPRIRLFWNDPIELDKLTAFDDVEPLFLPEDICVFDRYADGDPYEDEAYQKNFRLILDAIKNEYPLEIEWTNRRGEPVKKTVSPSYLEYSEKDDKFRLIGEGIPFGGSINLGRILHCTKSDAFYKAYRETKNTDGRRCVVFELTDERRALERVLLHFAHFEKKAEKLDEMHYRVTVYYDKKDEMEMVIRILSFGPMVRVVQPDHFIELMKKRLMQQKEFATFFP